MTVPSRKYFINHVVPLVLPCITGIVGQTVFRFARLYVFRAEIVFPTAHVRVSILSKIVIVTGYVSRTAPFRS